MLQNFNKTKKTAQILAVSNKLVVVAFSVIVAILVTTRLTSAEQGVYFVFQSMIAFSAIAELGVGYSITQLTGKAVGLGLASQSEPVEMIGARFLRFTVKWFAWVAIFVLIVIGPAGHYWLLSGYSGLAKEVAEHVLNWYILVLANSLLIFVNGVLAFLEGIGENVGVYLIRLICSFGSLAVTVLFISLGFGVQSMAIGAVVNVGITVAIVLFKFGNRLDQFLKIGRNQNTKIDWKSDIKPFQRDLSISWLFGVLSNHSAVPLVYRFNGPIDAGRLGLSIQMCSVINGISISWILASSSNLARDFGEGKWCQRQRRFKREFLTSIILSFCLVIALVIGLNIVVAQKFLDPLRIVELKFVYTLLIPIAIVAHLNNSMAVFIRSSGFEPLRTCSIISSIAMMFLHFALIPEHGAIGAIISIAIVTIFVNLPWILFFYKKDVKTAG